VDAARPGELTAGQLALLDALVESHLADRFYLTGGTALSAFYLAHRRSDDLDLFSREPVDAREVLRFMKQIADEEPILRRVEHRWGFLAQVGGESVRVEFVHYDHDWIEPPLPLRGALRVDGLRDLLANKLSAVIERTTGKDFADIVLLLRRGDLTLRQGVEDCRRKFGWPGMDHLVQPALLKVERVKDWPEVVPALTQEEATRELREHVRTLLALDEP